MSFVHLYRFVKRHYAVWSKASGRGYGTGRQRKFASLQLARDAKASRVEFANEPAATTSSSSTITVHGASENGTQCKFNSDISYVHLRFIQTSPLWHNYYCINDLTLI